MPPPGWLVTPITVVTICVLGIIGNLLCIIVLAQKEMRYSYVYNIRGLAYSDTLLLIIGAIRTLDKMVWMPTWMTSGNAYTKDVIFFAVWICNSGTKYFTVAVSFERFIVVTYPLMARNWVTVRRAKISAIAVFVFCVALAIFSYIYVNYIDSRTYSIWIVVILHFIPFVLVLIFNTFIFIGMQRYARHRKTMTSAQVKDQSITKMLFMVVLLFGVCSGVEVVRRIMIFFDRDIVEKPHYDSLINHFSDVFYVFNSAANFVIYYLWGKEFRKAFLKLFCCRGHGGDDSKRRSSSAVTASTTTIDETV